MRIQNIERVLFWRKLRGEIFTLEKIAATYPVVPAGTLDYYGFAKVNVEHFRDTGSALNDNHRLVLNALMRSLLGSDRDGGCRDVVREPGGVGGGPRNRGLHVEREQEHVRKSEELGRRGGA